MTNQFSPPYFFSGLYRVEERKRIEASNRATITLIFFRRAEENEKKRRFQEWLKNVTTRDREPYVIGPGSVLYFHGDP